ncbi:DUF2786 domain-containing protein [Actinacidiphila sp. bgisy160]|uniref:DUF2786 domain-containing protein n=1 Tax=Actinacidiphila sp. bgisy160 TaxID=3413796 RepID=UPI003D70AC72
MSTPTPESALNRARALLAKAQATTFPAEAEALTAKAAEILSKYGLDAAALHNTGVRPDVPEDEIVTITAAWSQELARLLYYVAEAYGCRPIMLSRETTMGANGKKVTAARVHLVGFRADVERAKIMHASLQMQMISAANREGFSGKNARSLKRAWMLGYIATVEGRLREIERRAKAQASAAYGGMPDSGRPGADLVLAERASLVRRRFNELFPRTRNARSSVNANAYYSGGRAGYGADLGQSRTGSTGRRALTR